MRVFAALIFCLLIIQPAEAEINNRIIYFIHGDGDYLYHDKAGNKFYSDEMILKQAMDNASKAVNSEYFIFHLKPKRMFLLVFPTEESDAYYYRGGELVSQKKYFRYEPVEGHSPESYMIMSLSQAVNITKNVFLYYGHEIPLEESYGYNTTFRSVPFGLETFAGRLKELLSSMEIPQFDLLVLSTCNNGSPEFISELSSVADYIIAAPGDLHLSQMNSSSLLMLDGEEQAEIKTTAGHFAATAFNSLRETTLTEIAVAVYETKKIRVEGYDFTGSACDDQMNEGSIRVFFQPAMFGKNKNKTTHTGWYCREKTITQK